MIFAVKNYKHLYLSNIGKSLYICIYDFHFILMFFISFLTTNIIIIKNKSCNHDHKCVEQKKRKKSSSLKKTIKLCLDVFADVTGEEVPRVPLDGGAVSGDEELLEVPGDVGPLDRLPDEELWISHQ